MIGVSAAVSRAFSERGRKVMIDKPYRGEQDTRSTDDQSIVSKFRGKAPEGKFGRGTSEEDHPVKEVCQGRGSFFARCVELGEFNDRERRKAKRVRDRVDFEWVQRTLIDTRDVNPPLISSATLNVNLKRRSGENWFAHARVENSPRGRYIEKSRI